MDQRYFQEWKSIDDVLVDYPDSGLRDDEVLFAYYGYGSYCGSATVLFVRDGTLYENADSHCSCYGLEVWRPTEVTWDQLALRKDPPSYLEEDLGGCALRALQDLIRSHVPRA